VGPLNTDASILLAQGFLDSRWILDDFLRSRWFLGFTMYFWILDRILRIHNRFLDTRWISGFMMDSWIRDGFLNSWWIHGWFLDSQYTFGFTIDWIQVAKSCRQVLCSWGQTKGREMQT